MTRKRKQFLHLSSALVKARAAVVYHRQMLQQSQADAAGISIQLAEIEYGKPGDQITIRIAGQERYAVIVRFDVSTYSPLPICVVSYDLAGKPFEDHISSGRDIIGRFPL